MDFLQNVPRAKPLVLRLEVPASGHSEVFHLLVLRYAGCTTKRRLNVRFRRLMGILREKRAGRISP